MFSNRTLLVGTAVSLLLLGVVAVAQLGDTQRISVGPKELEANGSSGDSAFNDDGRFIAYHSLASNLVGGDTNDVWDVFVFDTTTRIPTRVSVASDGTQGNGQSLWPAISSSGRFVTYSSQADNLVANDTNNISDIFVHDRQEGVTSLVSRSSGGTLGNRASDHPSISADGRYIVFQSDATNLVAGDTNGFADVFVHDRLSAATSRVSLTSSGTQGGGDSGGATISGDGRYVAFHSNAPNLVAGDTNARYDVFLHDRLTAETIRVSVDSNGVQAKGNSNWPSMSISGRVIAFYSNAPNLVQGDLNQRQDVFVRDLLAEETIRVSLSSTGEEGNNNSAFPSISSDGRYVAFFSQASNLVPDDTNTFPDTFVHDIAAGVTTMTSVATNGTQANGESNKTAISPDGRFVSFASGANNLVSGDGNEESDVFVRQYTEFARATGFTPLRGTLEGGNLESLWRSDDDRLIYKPGIVFTSSESPVNIEVSSISPLSSPATLTFRFEGHATSAGIQQQLELYDFTKNNWVGVDLRQSSLVDSVIEVVFNGDAGRFVGNANQLRARIRYKQNSPIFVFPWKIRIDEASWIIR